MKWITMERVKFLVAGISVFYLVLFIGYVTYLGLEQVEPEPESAELAATQEPLQEIMTLDRARELQERLGLSNEQTKQIAEIFFAQSQENGPDPILSGEDYRARIEARRAQRRAMHEQIREVLTPEQQLQYDELRRSFLGPRGGFLGPNPMMGPGMGYRDNRWPPAPPGMVRPGGGRPPGPGSTPPGALPGPQMLPTTVAGPPAPPTSTASTEPAVPTAP